MVDRVRAVIPNAKLVYNNSPSFNWTPELPPAGVHDAWSKAAGKDVSAYDRAKLMSVDYDRMTALAMEADEKIRTFQADSAPSEPASSTT